MFYVPKVLIADDEPRMCDSLKVLLSKQGYDAKTAYSGKEAIEHLAKDTFDLALLDIVMPDMTGHEVMDYINSRNPDTSVIVMTGHASVDSAIESLRRGAYDYIRKPFDFEQLLTRIRNALDQGALRKENERVNGKLELTEQRYRFLVNASPDIIYTLDHEGKFTFINGASESLLGYTSQQLIGKHYESIVFENDMDIAKNHFDERRTGGRAAEGIELRLKCCEKNGGPMRHLSVELKAMGIYDKPVEQKEKVFVGTYGVARDITYRKRLEAQLLQAQKMEAIGTLAGGIAHDFNNLLMGIQGIVSLMLMDTDSSSECHDRLKNIEKQVRTGAALTSQLLGYARKGRYEVKPLSLNKLVEETSETFGRTKKEITIYQELAQDLFAIEADQAQIEQVLLNLYVNGADAMPGGGDLTLKTMNTTHNDMKGKLYDPKPGKYVLLTVTDTGIGMDKETMERIFDPFFTTKEMGRGTGLGLASSYGIMKGHGGYVDVKSKKGHGTTFSIYLPASEKRVQKAVKTTERLIEGTGTVLLVDDEDVILQVGQELLETIGYRVLIARNGKEAIGVYKKCQDEIDIVILDIAMPKMGGGEAYNCMRAINQDVKVLLSSGYGIDGQATEILERGCDGFIQKPFNIRQLSQRIKKILDS